ncbi:MAG TPA: RloB domain-containing protein [Lachnospiraceae bacterium]|nr:RloB domain-containing protein [Lachnospiraceae bacterium]
MARRFKKAKPLIYVFCEGESEQAYTDFLKWKFAGDAVIKRPSSVGLFEEANSRFQKDPRFRNSADETDEIWFFFDVETKDVDKWDQRMKVIRKLRGLRKKTGIRVRLLMTTGCIEYWLMLHYKMYTPSLQSVAEKERVIAEVKLKEPAYSKGDYSSTARIAENYPKAVINAEKTVHNLLLDGLPEMEDTDERNRWLYTNCKTFSTVYEAIKYLESIKEA